MKIGLISDTHGLLRPEALQALAGVEHIIHAGDIGAAEVIESLRNIAPVDAVRGNNDKGPWAKDLPPWLALEFGGVGIHVLHDVKEYDVLVVRVGRKDNPRSKASGRRPAQKAMDVEPQAAGFRVVIAGHSHKPQVTERDGVLFVNPGSAGPRRFSLPVTIAYLTVRNGSASAEIRALL